MTQTIEQILENLSYSFSTPEAESLYEYIREKKFQKAKKMLLGHVNEEESKLVIAHFHKKNTKKVVLEEINIKDFDLTDTTQRYILKHGDEFLTGTLYIGSQIGFFTRSEIVHPSKMSQIWKIK